MLIALGVYFINGMFHDVSVQPMMNMTLFFLAGVTAGPATALTGCNHVSGHELALAEPPCHL